MAAEGVAGEGGNGEELAGGGSGGAGENVRNLFVFFSLVKLVC